VLHDGTIYVGSHDGHFRAIDPESGDVNWRFKTDAEIRTDCLIHENRLFFGSLDDHLYSLPLLVRNDGGLQWVTLLHVQN